MAIVASQAPATRYWAIYKRAATNWRCTATPTSTPHRLDCRCVSSSCATSIRNAKANFPPWARPKRVVGSNWDWTGLHSVGGVRPGLWRRPGCWGGDAWRALADYPFAYTTTYRRFYLLPGARAINAPALVYAARNRVGRLVSPPVMELLARCLEQGPLLRLALHPRDAHHPAILRHMQALLEQLLRTRAPMTKAAFAAQLASQSVGAMCTPTASDATSPV